MYCACYYQYQCNHLQEKRCPIRNHTGKYDLINKQKEAGVAVIYVGEDLDVLLELSDRILVLCGGQVSGIVDGRNTDKNQVGMLMTRVGGVGDYE